MANTDALLQTYSILALALAAGTNLSTTIVVLPSLLTAPSSTLSTQWKTLYDSGFAPMATLGMSSATGFATLAYRAHNNLLSPSASLVVDTVGLAEKRNLYVVAGVAAFGLLPYTKILMGKNIATLEGRAERVKKGEKVSDETHALVETWGRYNLWRGTMLLGGAIAGLWATLK